LEKIKPLLERISGQHQADSAMKNWLSAFEDCVEKADEVQKKCKFPTIFLCVLSTSIDTEQSCCRDSVYNLFDTSPLFILSLILHLICAVSCCSSVVLHLRVVKVRVLLLQILKW
jgi:hypothetical protein